jgi:hypothetical protein
VGLATVIWRPAQLIQVIDDPVDEALEAVLLGDHATQPSRDLGTTESTRCDPMNPAPQ